MIFFTLFPSPAYSPFPGLHWSCPCWKSLLVVTRSLSPASCLLFPGGLKISRGFSPRMPVDA